MVWPYFQTDEAYNPNTKDLWRYEYSMPNRGAVGVIPTGQSGFVGGYDVVMGSGWKFSKTVYVAIRVGDLRFNPLDRRWFDLAAMPSSSGNLIASNLVRSNSIVYPRLANWPAEWNGNQPSYYDFMHTMGDYLEYKPTGGWIPQFFPDDNYPVTTGGQVWYVGYVPGETTTDQNAGQIGLAMLKGVWSTDDNHNPIIIGQPVGSMVNSPGLPTDQSAMVDTTAMMKAVADETLNATCFMVCGLPAFADGHTFTGDNVQEVMKQVLDLVIQDSLTFTFAHGGWMPTGGTLKTFNWRYLNIGLTDIHFEGDPELMDLDDAEIMPWLIPA